MVQSVKWWYLQVFFHCIKRAKNSPKWKIKIWKKIKICHAPYLSNSVAYDHYFWYTCVEWWYLQLCFFLSFFQNFDFQVFRRREVEGQKMVQNDKKFFLSHFISQEPYIIGLLFMVQMCKMIYPAIFFVFQSFDFPGCWWGIKKAINGLKWQKILSVAFHISGSIHHMIVIYVMHVWNNNISRTIFHFFEILIFQVVRGVKGQKMFPSNKNILSVVLYISGTIDHMTVIYLTHL